MRRWTVAVAALAACGYTYTAPVGAYGPTGHQSGAQPGGSSSGGTVAGTGDGGGAAGTTGTGDAGMLRITTQRNAFGPKAVSLAQGSTVTWQNVDSVPHTVTSGAPGQPDGTFDQILQPGDSFSYTFAALGNFPYFCRYHFAMGMVGSVTITAAGNP